QKFRETPFLVKTVTLSGKNKAKDYYEQTIDLHGIDNKKDGERVISALLPGSSLLVKDLVISTSAQFQGRWKLGHEVMSGGKKQFEELFSGDVTSVGRRKSDIEIQINRVWPGRSLILKLDPAGKYLGSISALKITAYLPRLVFFADKAGTFLAQSGNGNKVRIKNIPGDQERQINKIISFSDVIENDKWRPESLVEKLSIAGGPFNEKGYRWTSRVAIPESGYYRLVLNQEASLSRNPGGLRLARDLVQIPYFRGQSEMQKITLQGISDYDKTRNTSVWTIQLPEPSNKLTEMTIESNGIFERKVMVEIAKPGHTGWQQWKELYWQNLANTPTVLHIGLEGLSKDTTELRIKLNHGDNRPIEISKIEAVYYAPTILFLINKPGEYVLFGGNPDAPETRYDLNLVQAHLTEAVPMPAMMEKTTPFLSSSLQLKVQEIFDDKSWGLYVVLGIVTLVLIILIIRLFPKAKKTET
ncbi:MAG: hypothetical protein Q8K68_01390, partial [Nitrospirota bacterium]|nr:hypothetical protein [Nitrospirota bacterium]